DRPDVDRTPTASSPSDEVVGGEGVSDAQEVEIESSGIPDRFEHDETGPDVRRPPADLDQRRIGEGGDHTTATGLLSIKGLEDSSDQRDRIALAPDGLQLDVQGDSVADFLKDLVEGRDRLSFEFGTEPGADVEGPD